jgi:ABC-2 type transport system permease protein
MMKQFGKILRFEFKNYLANKIFVGVTIFLVALIAIVMFFPRITGALGSGDEEDADTSERSVMLLAGDDATLLKEIEPTFADAFADYEVKVSEEDLDTVKKQITAGDAECAFVLDDLESYTYYVDNLSMYDANTEIADEILQGLYRMNALTASGLSAADAQTILSAAISHETEALGTNQAKNYFYTYIMIMALYMVMLLYGQMVATNVASEKSSRAMEVLITSAKPASMMFGKVLASCIAGFVQLVVIFGSAFVCFNLNKSYWGGNDIVTSIFDMPMELLVFMLVFFVLGFLIYAFLYGAIGSTVSKLEDINTAVQPITILFVIAFMVVMFSLASNTVDTPLMIVCSYVPFTSPMAMFTRIAMSTVPWYEITISIVILIASVIGVGVLSAKIYRVGVLLYGTSPKPGALIKAIRRA